MAVRDNCCGSFVERCVSLYLRDRLKSSYIQMSGDRSCSFIC